MFVLSTRAALSLNWRGERLLGLCALLAWALESPLMGGVDGGKAKLDAEICFMGKRSLVRSRCR